MNSLTSDSNTVRQRHRWKPPVDDVQLAGEHLQNDGDWPRDRCWISAYMKMHEMLIDKAKIINDEKTDSRERASNERGEHTQTVRSSMSLLRKEVFVLCPMNYLVSGIFFSMILTALSFTGPLISGWLVDIAVNALGRRSQGEEVDVKALIYPPLMIYAGALLASYLCEVIVGILFAICGHTTVTRLRTKLFRNLARQEIAFYDTHVSGELSSRLINDAAALSQMTQFTTQYFLGSLVRFVGSMIAMYSTHPKLASIACVIIPFSVFLVRKTGSVVGYYGVVQNDAMAKANSVAVEVLGAIRTVQSNVGEAMEGNRFMDRMNYYLRVIKATVYIETVLRFTNYGLAKSRDVLLMGIGMNEVATGGMTIGQWTAFMQLVILSSDGFNNLAEIWLNFKQTITSTGKFVQLLLRQPQIPYESGLQPEACSGCIELVNVTFAYATRPDKPVLTGVSMKAVPGSVIALVGESGAGKSTIGRLLQRFYDPSSGQVLLDGVNFQDLNVRWLRSQIGVVEQEPVLFDRPLFENIAYGSAQERSLDECKEAAKKANAHDFIEKLEGGYMAAPGERAARISGGQKQRCAIARAIVRCPKVLLLDEATSALDAENEFIVQTALDNLMQGKTTFVIAHRLSTVVRATTIMVLDQGVVVEQGSHDELNAMDGKYASFMKYQMVSPLLS